MARQAYALGSCFGLALLFQPDSSLAASGIVCATLQQWIGLEKEPLTSNIISGINMASVMMF